MLSAAFNPASSGAVALVPDVFVLDMRVVHVAAVSRKKVPQCTRQLGLDKS
jgi:hypothetical protein